MGGLPKSKPRFMWSLKPAKASCNSEMLYVLYNLYIYIIFLDFMCSAKLLQHLVMEAAETSYLDALSLMESASANMLSNKCLA